MTRYLHHDLAKRGYCDWVAFLKRKENVDKTRADVDLFQLTRLKEVMAYAYRNTRAYRNLYNKADILPSDIYSLADVRKIPLITREQIKVNLEDFSVQMKRRRYVTSGGSTGLPIGFYYDYPAFTKELASKAFQYYRVGWHEGDRQMVLRGLVIKGKNHMNYVRRFNELRCSSYHLIPGVIEEFRKAAFSFKPDWLKSYPSSCYILAKYLRASGLSFPPLKGILCASENLYDFQRREIEKVFKTRIFNHYGHYELSVLAGYCEYEDTFHVLPYYGYAELIDDNGEQVTKVGATGEIVGTSFIMKATPFIRYRTGDLAVFRGIGCRSCGRPYEIWDKIEGRTQDFAVSKSGRLVSATALNMHDNIFDHVLQFQFFQTKKGVLIFKYIPSLDCNDGMVERMKQRILTKLGDGFVLIMMPISESQIEHTKRGKTRFLVQKLKTPLNYERK